MSGYSCLDPPLSVIALDGWPLGAGLVSRVTSPVRLQTAEVFPPHPVSRLSCGPGVPLADPSQLDWITHTILEWGPTQVSSPHSTLELSQFPPEYYGLSEVFMKKRATVLPPHRSYDCAVDLLSGTCPPRRRIFSFSGPECVAMTRTSRRRSVMASSDYHPRLLGLAASLDKKDGDLKPCSNYQSLNKVAIRNR